MKLPSHIHVASLANMAHSESESGWTTYLNTSCDSWVVSGNEDHGVSGEHNIFAANDKYVGVCEEDSTASDASSGPEQPCSQGLFGDDEMQQGTFVGMAIAPKRSSDALYMGAMDCVKMCSRPAKRDRQSTGTVVACSDLEDTASSPVRLNLVSFSAAKIVLQFDLCCGNRSRSDHLYSS